MVNNDNRMDFLALLWATHLGDTEAAAGVIRDCADLNELIGTLAIATVTLIEGGVPGGCDRYLPLLYADAVQEAAQ